MIKNPFEIYIMIMYYQFTNKTIMKRKNRLTNIVIAFSIFTIGASYLASYQNKAPIRVEAVQHENNYGLYIYSGDYYDGFNFNATQGMNNTLRQNLTTKIHPTQWYTYSGDGDKYLSTVLQSADEDPTNSNNMIYLYSRDSVKKNAAITWNREHVWPQSLSNDCWGTTHGGGSDLLHIRPTYQSTNSTRGNDLYGDVADGETKVFNHMTYGKSGGGYFEPIDAVKGDVARIIMYTWVAYKNHYSNLPDVTNVFKDYNTLLRWHTLDKPDILEGNRNNYCEKISIQGNRNPFVDHPELAWKIFGEKVSSTVKTNCMNTYPENGYAQATPTGITLDTASISLKVDSTYTLIPSLEPAGATGTVLWTSNATTVASVDANGKVTAISSGTATITARISNSLYATCEVTVRSNNLESSMVKVSSIAEGDIVYLTADGAGEQYIGPNTSGSSAYGEGDIYVDIPDASKCPLEVENGSSSNTYSFKIKEGTYANKYLYWTSGNYLGTNANKNANSSWKVSFDANGNARIANSSDNTRIIWWNVTSPRFACYTNKDNDNGFKPTQLWKEVASQPVGPEVYMQNAISEKSIHGTETQTESSETSTNSLTFSSFMTNAQALPETPIGDVTLTGAKGTHSNSVPAYYTSGSALRIYAGNTLTFDGGDCVITSIQLTYPSNYSNGFTVDVGTLSSNTWNGSSKKVIFSATTTTRLTSVSVTYKAAPIVSINGVYLKFSVTISQSDWAAIDAEFEISDYGFMYFRRSKAVTSDTPVQDAIDKGKSPAVRSNGSSDAPALVNGNYTFEGVVNMSDYDVIICAAPYIVAAGEVHFFTEANGSVRSIADHCIKNGGSELSETALTILKGNYGE